MALLCALTTACDDGSRPREGGESCERSSGPLKLAITFDARTADGSDLLEEKLLYSGAASVRDGRTLELQSPGGRTIVLEVEREDAPAFALPSGIEPWVMLESPGRVGFEGAAPTTYLIVRDGYAGRILLAAYAGSDDLLQAFATKLDLPISLVSDCTFADEARCGTSSVTLLRARFDADESVAVRSNASAELELDGRGFEASVIAERTTVPPEGPRCSQYTGTSTSLAIALLSHSLEPEPAADASTADEADAGDDEQDGG